MNPIHSWPTDINAAIALQQELRGQVCVTDDFGEVQTVAGVDVGFEQDNTVARAAVVVLSYFDLRPLDYAIARRPVTFPYVPGLLSFRETPVILDALDQLATPPDLIICDGQGIAHPRRLGIASHLGLIANIPTIGCAKSLLVGHHGQLPKERGAAVPLVDSGEQIGVVLRTRSGTKPVYVSPGHRVSMASAVSFVMGCVTKYRLPETTRAAHNLASHGIIPNVKRDTH
ncbi:MAG: deoxyribonuclease V [Chloroflexales bacterium]|nr:deoxyribonuclease V [Chloroflexales bacterium]